MASSGPFYQELTLEPEIIGGAVPGVARMPNGDILAIWSDTENVLGARSSDAGVSWSEAEVLAPSVDGDPVLLAARRGTALHFSKGERDRPYRGAVHASAAPVYGGAAVIGPRSRSYRQ